MRPKEEENVGKSLKYVLDIIRSKRCNGMQYSDYKNAYEIDTKSILIGSSSNENIVNEFVTSAFVKKEYYKLVNDNGGWPSKLIPQFLNRVFYGLIKEESWPIIKKFKNPTINFKTLYSLTINRTKTIMPQLFM